MPTKPPPELLPFLDALAELLADQVLKELRKSPEQASAPTVSDGPPRTDEQLPCQVPSTVTKLD